jgi:hypothetical protein
MSRYYVHDLADDKLHLHTDGKADWNTLPEDVRKAVKGSFLWSGSRGFWIGRRKGSFAWCLDILKANGFEDRGTQGERLSFAEQIQSEESKAGARAERMEGRAEKAEAEARHRFSAARAATAAIPFGQPILIGHHSEKRHRAALARSDANMRAGCEASDKAKHYADRAAAAAETASGEKFTDPRYLGNRIAEVEVEERDILRRLAEADGKIGDAYARYRDRMAEALARVRERLEFYRGKLAACGKAVYTRETLAGKTFVMIRGTWQEVVRLNPKTVSTYNTCFPTRETQAKWPLKYLYTEVQEAK